MGTICSIAFWGTGADVARVYDLAHMARNSILSWRDHLLSSAGVCQALIAALVIFLATAYDKGLWQASDEPRWMLAHILVLAAASVYLLGHARNGPQGWRKQPLPVWLAVLFGLSALLSVAGSFDLLNSWWSLKNVIACVGLFLLVVALRSERWYWTLAWLLVLTLGFNGFLSILQFHGVTDQGIVAVAPWWQRLGPVIGYFAQAAVPGATFINKNVAASYLVLILPVGFAVFLGSRSRLAQYVAVFCVTLGATAWAYSRTRSSWIGLSVALIALVLLVARSEPARALISASFSRSHKVLALIAGTVFLFAISIPSQSSTGDRPGALTEQMGAVFDSQQTSYLYRWSNNLNSLKMAVDHPFNGVGIGAFRVFLEAIEPILLPEQQVGRIPQRACCSVVDDALGASG